MTSRRRPASPPPRHRRGGFTLIELMVVIGIIVLLAAILIPVAAQVRKAAFQASTESEMQRIMQACQSYYHDFSAYPGPIPNTQLQGFTGANLKIAKQNGGAGIGPITSSENLVLGLLGFMNSPASATAAPKFNNTGNAPVLPPAHDVLSLNFLHPASYHYIDFVPDELSSGTTNTLESMIGVKPTDTIIPEFLDRFPDKMPILYMRAYVGNAGTPPNSAVSARNGTAQYNPNELSPYGCNIRLNQSSGGNVADPQLLSYSSNTSSYIATLNTDATSSGLDAEIQTPYQDYDGTGTKHDGWLANPNIAGSARGKDGFVLISAGKDRVYGTHDDTILTP